MSNQTTSPRHIQTWADWKAALKNKSNTEAERKLVEACLGGRQCTLGDGARPKSRSPKNEIGSDLLRYLIKGGCDACDLHDWGVDLVGAYITGDVDLRLVKATGVTSMINCHFEAPIDAMYARLYLLNLCGSSYPSLYAHGINVTGSVILDDGFAAEGEVSLSGAVIGGSLYCAGGSFENAKGHALNAEGVDVKGRVALSAGFTAKGEVSLSGAVIGGQLSCNGGSFENAEGHALNAQGVDVKADVNFSDGFGAKGEVSLLGAVIGGQLSCFGGSFENAKGSALNVQNAEMNALIWVGVKRYVGDINLAGVKTLDLNDDAASWALVDHAYLDGIVYQTIHGPLDTKMRLEWLGTTSAYDGSFSPQPYEQLAWTLKRMGHSEQRRVILIEKEKRQRSYERRSLCLKRRLAKIVSRLSAKQDKTSMEAVIQHQEEVGAVNQEYANHLQERYRIFHHSWPQWAQKEGVPSSEIARAQTGFREELFWQNGRIWVRIAWMHIKDHMARHLVGYGYRPFKFFWALALLIGIGWGVAHQAYEQGDFAPNSDVILSTSDWQALAEGDSKNPAREWAAKTGKGRDYETFYSLAYAVDVIIPIVSLGQEASWAPSTTRGPWGATLWWLRWFLTLSGWIVTAVGAAAITGIIRRE